MAVTRTHFSFRIDVWTTNGESMVEKGRRVGPCPPPGTLARGYSPRACPHKIFPGNFSNIRPTILRGGALWASEQPAIRAYFFRVV